MFRKAMRFPGLMMPVLIIAFLCLLSGCGTGGLADAPAGTSPSPTPTTDLSVSIAASPTSVSNGQTSIITATVTGDNSSGAAVVFSLPVNSSGASFINASGSSVSSITVTASGSGIATAIYKAGSTSSGTEVQDIVQAVLTNGANGAVILTRTTSTISTYTVVIAASATSVTAGQVSIITATVTSTSGSTSTPAGGVTVTFTLPVDSSGATLSAATATTDGSGKAVVTYLPGTKNPTLAVDDTVQAAVGTATSALAITRAGSATTIYAVSIGTSATSVTAGQVSIITATVTSGSTASGGVTVTFALPINSSGATLSAATATTDGSGKAVVTYLPGTTNPTLAVDDTVQAAVGTATSALVITRAGSATTIYAVSIGSSATSVTAGQVSIITATVTSTSGSTSTPAGGVTVSFTLPVNNSGGTLMTTPSGTGTTVTATTDLTGKAVAIYQPGTTNFDRTVSDSVRASVTGASTAVSITRTGSFVSDIRIDVVSGSDNSSWNGQSVITAKVINNDDSTPISGVTVTFSVAAGGTAGGSVSPSTATTDNNGDAVSVYMANNNIGPFPNTAATDVVMVSVTRSGYTYTDGVLIPVGAHP